MKVLIISQYYKPDITAVTFRISETVSGLKEKYRCSCYNINTS